MCALSETKLTGKGEVRFGGVARGKRWRFYRVTGCCGSRMEGSVIQSYVG